MSENDFMEATPGEIYDLVACFAVYNGDATEVRKKKYTYDEALAALKV